jgi:hydroxypyruvate isomerase
MYLSACIEWLFQAEHDDIAERVDAAKAAGLGGVEFHLWRNKPIDRIADAVRRTGMRVTSIVVDPRCHLANPVATDEIVKSVRESSPAAKAVGAPAMVVASGPSIPGVDEVATQAAMVTNLKAAAPIVEAAGITLLVEPLNTRVEHPGMFLDSTRRGLDIIDAVGRKGVRLLFDAYHSATMGEQVEDVLEGRIHLVGHVQVADSPGRGEPGSGTIDWTHVMSTLRRVGYDGAIGLEYKPTSPTLASLERARSHLGV